MPSTWITATGQTTRRPGVTSLIDGTALAGKGPVGRGGLALLVEAPTLAPYAVNTAANAGALKRLIPDPLGTPIAKCIFSPSADPRVPSGASFAKIVNVCPSTQALLVLNDAALTPALTLYSAKYGLGGNNIQAALAAGTVSGKKFTATNGVTTEIKDNITVNQSVLGLLHTDSITDASVTAHVTEAQIDPNGTLGATGDAGVAITQEVKIAESHVWTVLAADSVAFDGKIHFTVGNADTVDFTIVGVNKATGATVTETVSLVAATDIDSTNAYSSVTSIAIPALTNPADVTATVSWYAFDLALATYDTIGKVIAKVQQKATQGFAAAAKIGATTFTVANLDNDAAAVALANVGTEALWYAQLYYLITAINANFSLVTAARATGALDIADNFVATNLTGGSDGVADASTYELGLNALKTVSGISVVVVLSTVAGVHGKLSEHLVYMAGAGRDERIGFVGLPKQTNKGTIQSLIAALNNRNVGVAINDIDLYDYTGTQTTYGPEYLALMLAAADAGRRNEYSITWVPLDIVDYGDNAADAVTADRWSEENDAEDLLSYGAIFMSTDVGTGVARVERDVTSYLTDDNPIFSSVYANESANFSIKNVRRQIEAFIGSGNFDGTAFDVKENVRTELQRQVDNREIKAFNASSVTVTDLGNGFDVDYEVAVTESLYFINQTAHIVRIPTSA